MSVTNRRTFIRNLTGTVSGTVFLGGSLPLLNSCTANAAGRFTVNIPMPLQVVIDDVGWWSGEDGSKRNEPYRTGINRHHVPADYTAIAELGRRLGIRPQAAFVLCEWDKENILRQLPTSTWMGENWDNSRWVGPWMDEAADIIRQNRDHFELTLHGIGHEYWNGGTFTRAEWTGSDGVMRSPDQVRMHLDFFGKILDQHNLGPFPESFVPCAFRHSFGPSEGRSVSLASLLSERGIHYINTPFSIMFNKERVQYPDFGFDDGLMTVDRGEDQFDWNVFPAEPLNAVAGPTCGMHWPNLLHPDPERNEEIVDKWVNYLKPYNDKPDMMLAPDSRAFRHQLAHHTLTTIRHGKGSFSLGFGETDKLPGEIGKQDIVLKIKTEKPVKFHSDDAGILSQSLTAGTGLQYTLVIRRRAGIRKTDVLIGMSG